MLDHIGYTVRDYALSRAFFLRCLAPLGYGLVIEFPKGSIPGHGAHAGFGPPDRPAFWISEAGRPLESRLHIAFAAKDRAQVDAFHAAALAAGGVDNGPPGLRPHYHAQYYGAFIIDPDGHNIEAVCHSAP